MIPARLIERKRGGGTLDALEIERFFGGYLAGEVTDYQMSAFLMAVYFHGLERDELAALLRVMIRSGATLDLSGLPVPSADKHSTGGIGDKVSLVLAPLAAELGLGVPMMSGRGLAHTGGTLDKLESIPGFRTDLSLSRMQEVLRGVGCVMTGQTAEIAPLDRRLYDLRNATGTVASLPLIATSIMSKKLAEGIQGLVLDVKVGAGAFLPEEDDALELAETMVEMGETYGVRTNALLTAMDRPLGGAIGNALEVREAIECLGGAGPDDLRELALCQAAEMAMVSGVWPSPSAARAAAAEALDGGGALDRFASMVEAQGGDAGVVGHPERLPRAPVVLECAAERAGVVAGIAPRTLGWTVVEMGGGRRAVGDPIDLSVGFVLHVVLGQHVEPGDLIGEVHAADSDSAARACRALRDSVEIKAGSSVSPRPLISHRVSAVGVERL